MVVSDNEISTVHQWCEIPKFIIMTHRHGGFLWIDDCDMPIARGHKEMSSILADQ
jgi:hypothetical protein